MQEDTLLTEGQCYRGCLTRDGEEHFLFEEEAHTSGHRHKRNPKLFDGRFVSTSQKSFVFNSVPTVNAVAVYGHDTPETMPWTVNPHMSNGMYCVTAVLSVEGDRSQTGEWYVGAFDGDQCIGLATMVDSLLFIPVHANTLERQFTDVSFRAVNRHTGSEEALYETVHVTADGVLGSISAPFTLNTGDPTKVFGVREADGFDAWNLKGQKLDGAGQERIVVRNGRKELGR